MPFAIYIRVSEVGDRDADDLGTVEDQEADARAWAEKHGEQIVDEEPTVELDVSGATKVDERRLGKLIARCEAGELAGIIVRFQNRFARDVIESALALERLVACGARLVAVKSGFDSANLTHDTEMLFNIMASIAQAERKRNRQFRLDAAIRAAEKGNYLACRPPVGYVKDWEHDGRIEPHPELAELIVQAFERRARGETCQSIAMWLREAGAEIQVLNPKHPKRRKASDPETVRPLAGITENGVRHLLASRAYLGESERPRKPSEPVELLSNGKEKTTATIRNAHRPIVAPELWERAQAAGGPIGRNTGRWASQCRLSGLVYCPNGHRLKTAAVRTGKGHVAAAAYTCTRAECSARATIHAASLDGFVAGLILDAVIAGEPHVVAVLEGDNRYQRAFDDVEAAKAEVDAYRDGVGISDVGGVNQWKRGLSVRLAKLEASRRELKATPRPENSKIKLPLREDAWAKLSVEERRKVIGATLDRESNVRFIDRVVVKPVGRGRRVPAAERSEVWLLGAEAPLDVAEITPVGDPATIALLESAHTK